MNKQHEDAKETAEHPKQPDPHDGLKEEGAHTEATQLDVIAPPKKA